MNIALLGCGRTGREIEAAAPTRGHTIAACFTSHTPLSASNAQTLRERNVECCIDFSVPRAALSNIACSVRAGIPIVVGTTGWHDRLEEARALVDSNGGALVYASNFSPGAILYLRLIREAAQLFNAAPDYDAAIHEIHHRHKIDAPSGTARVIAEILLDGLERKTRLRAAASAGALPPVAPEELSITSARVGAVFGTHTVTFSSDADDIELTHRAQNRKGFALGALMAAEWVQGRHGVFTAEDVVFG